MILETKEIGAYPVRWVETLTSGWIDITNISNINKYWKDTNKDYKYNRDAIKALFTTWGSHTADEQLIFVEHKIGSHADRLARVGSSIPTLVQYGLQYAKRVSESRTVRLAYAMTCLYNQLPNNAESVIPEVDVLVYRFVFFGTDGTVQGDVIEGLSDWLNGLGTFTGVGLIDKGWTTETGTLAELVDDLEEKLFKGNY